MKNKAFLSVLLSCVMIAAFGLAPRRGEAASLGIGAASWYAWWLPNPPGVDAEADPGIMYGPQFLLMFSQELSISSVFLYGEFDYRQEGFNETIKRYDSDTTLNYALNRYIRVFGGLKFMGYDYGTGTHLGAGPGLGVGLVLPLGGGYYCALNGSGLYLWGKQEDDSSSTSVKFNEWGVNTTLSLVYLIPSSSVSLSVGGRYFYFKTNYERQTNGIDYESHQFYGVTASAMYMINL